MMMKSTMPSESGMNPPSKNLSELAERKATSSTANKPKRSRISGQRQRQYWQAVKAGTISKSEWMQHVMVETVIQAALPGVITGLGWGVLTGDDEDRKQKWLAKEAADVLSFSLSGLPVIKVPNALLESASNYI